MRMALLVFGLALGLAAGVSRQACAQIEPERAGRDTSRVHVLDPMTVEGRIDDLTRIATTASEGRVGIEDLRLRPITREGELLETVPGMILTQHSGDGKSNQMFVRGFNLDHGTDFATRIEGMPVNLPTHAHGQGYTDLNILIPEIIDFVEYRLGVYHPAIGDFGSAGGAEFHIPQSLPEAFFRMDAGQNGYSRLVGAGSKGVGSGSLLVGGEVKGYDGPWDVPLNLRKWSALTKYTWQSGNHDFSLLAMGYRNRWDASDQIPRRAVETGVIGRFGQVDSTLGGNSQRYSLSGAWNHTGNVSTQHVRVYGIYYDLDLYSNFTYFLDDPLLGDQLNQVDERWVAGANIEYRHCTSFFERTHLLTVGVQTRADVIDIGLHNTLGRQRTSTIRRDDVFEWGTGAYVSVESEWSSIVRTLIGVRGDVYLFDVASDRPENAGTQTDALVTPKVSLILGPWARIEFYLSGGFGFHSNDARGTTTTVDPQTGDPADPVDPLVLSRGGEFGVRSTPVSNWRSTLAVWFLQLDSELLFVGDAGHTEPTNESRRFGITWTNYIRPVSQLSLDLDISFTDARYVGVPEGETFVPGALENVVAAGITWDAVGRGLFGTLRLRHLGKYPLTEDNGVRAASTTLLNASVGYHFAGLRVTASLLNVLDASDADIQYYYASRGPSEPTGGVEDLHFHPVEPRQLRMSVSWGF